jgi:predicted anti-sigma-YlaC factor YlaD
MRFKIDWVFAPFYGVGKMISYMLWCMVALMLLTRYGLDMTPMIWGTTILIGAIGTYYFGIRQYEKQLK